MNHVNWLVKYMATVVKRLFSMKNLPVTFPMAASACSSCFAAVRLANVSGKLVPRAMMVIPVTLVFRPITQPIKWPSYNIIENSSSIHKDYKLTVSHFSSVKHIFAYIL